MTYHRRMKKLALFWRLLFLAVNFSFMPPISAQSGETPLMPEQLLPPETLAVCVFPNVQATLARFEETLLGRSPEFAKIRPALSRVSETFRPQAGFALAELSAIFRGSVTVALVDVARAGTPPPPAPQFVVLADVTDSAAALQNLLETVIIPGIQAKAPSVEFRVESFAGRDLYVLANAQFQVYYAFFAQAVVLAFDQETMRQIMAVAENNAAENLFTAVSYREVVGDIAEDPHDARLYVDMRNLWRTLRPFFPQTCATMPAREQRLILNVLDQYPLYALFWTFAYKDGGGYERLFFKTKILDNHATPAVVDASARAAPAAQGAFASERLLPANVLYYGASKLNWLAIWQQLTAWLRAAPEPQQMAAFQQWTQSIEAALQLNIATEFLPAFGQEFAVAWHAGELRPRSAREKAALPDLPLIVLVQVQNQAFLTQALQKAARLLQLEIQPEKFRNREITAVTIPGASAPFTVYAAFVEDFLAVTFSRTLLQDTLTAAQTGRSLAAADDYRQLSAYFPANGYAKGYLNLKKFAAAIQRVAQRNRQREPALPGQTAPLAVDWAALAEPGPGLMWLTTVVSDGFLTESFSPLGGIVAWLTLAGLGLAWAGN